MDLPKLSPGKRFTLPRPPGSADALLLARLAEREKAGQRRTAIVTADASDAQRLIDEMAFFAPELRCALFPDWETLPYDQFSPHQDLISERLATLWRIGQKDAAQGADVVLVPATTALYRLAPPAFLAGYTFHFKVKQKLDEAQLRAQLTLAGYQHVTQVVSPGEYAVRGGLIDLFPMGSLQPYRVDLFDDEIDSIRTFDPDSQRSLYPVPEVRLLPGREFPMDDEARATLPPPLARAAGRRPDASRIYKDMGAGRGHAPASSTTCRCSSRHRHGVRLPGGEPRVALHGEVDEAPAALLDGHARAPQAGGQGDPMSAPAAGSACSCDRTAVRRRSTPSGAARCAASSPSTSPARCPTWRGARRPGAAGAAARRHLDSTPHRVLLLAESEGRREALLDLLREHKLDAPSVASLAEFEAGGDEKVAHRHRTAGPGLPLDRGRRIGSFVTETELFATLPSTRRAAASGRSRPATSTR
jgi:transcription-repair coupling factor (superfamily II helicase)